VSDFIAHFKMTALRAPTFQSRTSAAVLTKVNQRGEGQKANLQAS